jgi:hypothetical protein
MTETTNNKQVSLLNESTTFTRIPHPEGGGELLEVKVTTKIRTQLGVLHDATQSFVLSGQDASDTLASLRVIHNNLQLMLMKVQQEAEKAPEEQSKDTAASLNVLKTTE